MSGIGPDRAQWLAHAILPHEAGLRQWLGRAAGPDIDDLIQETYAVLAALPSVEHIENPRAYMFRTAHRLLLQQLRRSRIVSIQAMADIEILGLEVDAPSPERQAADRQELQRVADAMAALPARCGEAFRLRKVEGLSQRAIAERMGLSESTVEKHIAKAVKILADLFGRGGTGRTRASGARELFDETRHYGAPRNK